MICVLKFKQSLTYPENIKESIKGWIIANDMQEAQSRAQAAMLPELAVELSQMNEPTDGIQLLDCGFILLAQRNTL